MANQNTSIEIEDLRITSFIYLFILFQLSVANFYLIPGKNTNIVLLFLI